MKKKRNIIFVQNQEFDLRIKHLVRCDFNLNKIDVTWKNKQNSGKRYSTFLKSFLSISAFSPTEKSVKETKKEVESVKSIVTKKGNQYQCNNYFGIAVNHAKHKYTFQK